MPPSSAMLLAAAEINIAGGGRCTLVALDSYISTSDWWWWVDLEVISIRNTNDIFLEFQKKLKF